MTWLFTWNPKRYSWLDSLYSYTELVHEIEQIGFTYTKWTCGGTKSIQTGDRIFFIRLGENPKGIMASGYAASPVFEGSHWDENRARQGILAKRVLIKMDKILLPHQIFLDLEKLHEIDSNYHWLPQSSGVRVPEETAKILENHWESKNVKGEMKM